MSSFKDRQRRRGGGNKLPSWEVFEEDLFYAKTPKWLLYEVARQLAALVAGKCDDLQTGAVELARYVEAERGRG